MGAGLLSILTTGGALHLTADVTHARRGALRHAFRYRVDYLLLSPEAARPQGLFRLGRAGLFSFHAPDHGGARGAGEGAAWAWRMFEQAGLIRDDSMTLALMAQPRFFGFWFNPVSFWMVLRSPDLLGRADPLRSPDLLGVIAEVNNTFGQRHSYLCHMPDFAPIRPSSPDRTAPPPIE